MTVSVGLFSIAVLISVSALIALSNEARKVQSERAVIGNLGSTIESMTRTIRMGKGFHCYASGETFTAISITSGSYSSMPDFRRSCEISVGPGGGSNSGGTSYSDYLAFMPITADPNTRYMVFRLNKTTKTIERSVDGGLNWQQFTSPEIGITYLKFYVSGAENGKQPMVTMVISGYTDTNRPTDSTFTVQTTVAARTPNS
jgi:hypothetical protein